MRSMCVRFAVALCFLVPYASSGAMRAAPAPPSGLAASVVGSTVTLTWSTGLGVTGHRLEAGTAPTLADVANVVVGPTPSFTAVAVPAGVYFVRVRAIDASGESAPSNEVTVVVGGSTGLCNTVPDPPIGLVANVAGSVISFAWAASTGCPATGYTLHAGSAPGMSDLAVVPVGAALSFGASAPDGTYYVRLIANNAFGSSSPSNEIAVVVGSPSPAPLPSPAGGVEVNMNTATVGADFFGDTVVIGEVVNRTASTVAFAKVNAAVRNPAGALIATDFTYVSGRPRRLSGSSIITDTTLAPGESGCFKMFIDVPHSQVGHVELNTGFDVRVASGLRANIIFLGEPTRRSSLGDLRLVGEVRNDGAALAYFVKTVFYIQHADGRAADCDFTYVTGAPVQLNSGITTDTGVIPGGTATYDAFTNAPDNAPLVTAWAQWDEGTSALANSATRSSTVANADAATPRAKRQAREEWERLQAQLEAAARQHD